jgi:hypothetical protein
MNAVHTWPFQRRFSGAPGGPSTVEAPRYDTMKGSGDSAMRPRTIVILVLAGVIGVFLVVGLAGLFLAA